MYSNLFTHKLGIHKHQLHQQKTAEFLHIIAKDVIVSFCDISFKGSNTKVKIKHLGENKHKNWLMHNDRK
uniref:Uncharacterized protein n=1 Tax=Anguilla anguilla TaxID=7936 RepID=A0A0E9VI70_ANGAN